MEEIAINEEHFSSYESPHTEGKDWGKRLSAEEIDQLYRSLDTMIKLVKDCDLEQRQFSSMVLQKYAQKSLQIELVAKNVIETLEKRIQRMVKNKRYKKNWSLDDANVLYWIFSHYCQLNNISNVEQMNFNDWNQLASLIPGTDADSCMFKILDLRKIKLSQQKWTRIQSGLLFEIVTNSKVKNWRVISQQLFKKNQQPNKIFRNAKHCKQHWVCYLNPEIKKGIWSLQEDIKLLECIYHTNGSKKWADIARIFGCRTQNALKNRYTLILEKLRKQKNGNQKQFTLIKEFLTKMERDKAEKMVWDKTALKKKIKNTENQVIVLINGEKQIVKAEISCELPDSLNQKIIPFFNISTEINLPYINMCNENIYSMQLQYIPANQYYFLCSANFGQP